jgi:hypothetical protein
VRALLWTLFAWSAWDQAATEVEARQVTALPWPLFAVVVGSASHYDGEHEG